jgi:hypothetical protein
MKNGVILLASILLATSVSAQTLVEMARREKERRQTLAGRPVRTFTNVFNRETGSPPPQENGSVDPAPSTAAPEESASTVSSTTKAAPSNPPPKASPATPQENAPARGVVVPVSAPIPSAPQSLASSANPAQASEVSARRLAPSWQTTFYLDWFRVLYSNGLSAGELSSRVKLEAGVPGEGWRAFLDVRERFNRASEGANQLTVYEARLSYDRAQSPYQLSLGQRTLSDSAGAGQLLGGQLGYRFSPAVTVGGYLGLEPDLYALKVDAGYQKYGFFTRYDGSSARSAVLSLNSLRFRGANERSYLYTSALLPWKALVLFGNLEYELHRNIAQADRLSRVFLNGRYSFSQAVDLTAHYSSGKGLDYHRFLLEQSQNPGLASAEIERYYFSRQFGARLGVRPHRQLRFYLAQQRSEQKDRGIRNNSTQFGGAIQDIVGSGLGFSGNYSLNRGDASESNTYSLSLTRDFGRLSWTGYYSNSFNGVRFDATNGAPQIIRIVDRSTVSNDFFFVLNRAVILSFQHEYSAQGDDSENAVFLRVIYRN